MLAALEFDLGMVWMDVRLGEAIVRNAPDLPITRGGGPSVAPSALLTPMWSEEGVALVGKITPRPQCPVFE